LIKENGGVATHAILTKRRKRMKKRTKKRMKKTHEKTLAKGIAQRRFNDSIYSCKLQAAVRFAKETDSKKPLNHHYRICAQL
jgi:carbamate kinase